MTNFNLDLGLERYDGDEKSNLYLSGGVKIEAGETAITSFDYSDAYLGTYITIIWKNIASNAAELSEKDEIIFEVMTEGWDPEYKVEKINDKRLKISMTEKSVEWSDDIEIPEKVQNGIEIDANDFFNSIINSGENLRELCQKIGSKSSTVSELDKLIEKVEQCKEKYERTSS